MRLYVLDKRNGSQVYLNLIASTRADLAWKIRSQWFHLNNQNFHVSEVYAETDTNTLATGAIVGGLVGLLGGPIGVLAGGLIGGALGNDNDKADKQKVDYFNSSRI